MNKAVKIAIVVVLIVAVVVVIAVKSNKSGPVPAAPGGGRQIPERGCPL